MKICMYFCKCLTAIPVLAAVVLTAGCGAEKDRAAIPKRAGNELVLAVAEESPPYTLKGANGEICGIDIDIARATAAKMGRPLKIRIESFDSLLPLLKAGEADMAASGITITEGRLRSVDFSDSYVDDGGAFLYSADKPAPTLVTAASVRLATVDATTHDFYLTSHGLDPIRYSPSEYAVKDLLSGKVDAVYSDLSTLSEWAAKSKGRFAVSQLVTRENIGIAIRKGFPELKDAVNAVIRERKAK